MIGVLLSLMKVIGIIILVLILIILLIVALILFAPIIYKGEICYKKEADIDINISWFFKFLNISIKYRENFGITAKLAWFFKFYSNKEDEAWDDEEAESQGIEVKEDTLYSHDKAVKSSERVIKNSDKNIKKSKVTDLEKAERRQSKRVLSGKNKTENRFTDRLRYAWNKIKNIIDMIRDKENKKLLYFLSNKAVKLLKHILPKKIKGYVKFGFADPSATGQILSGLAIFYPLYKDDFKIIPMFYDEIFEIDIFFKKGITLAYIIYILATIWFNKNFKRAYRKYRKGQNGKKQ